MSKKDQIDTRIAIQRVQVIAIRLPVLKAIAVQFDCPACCTECLGDSERCMTLDSQNWRIALL